MQRAKDVTKWSCERDMPRKTHLVKKTENSDDPEQLQMMDENNAEWVEEWKRTVKLGPKTK